MLLFESWQASVRDYLKETDEVKKNTIIQTVKRWHSYTVSSV